LRSLSVPGSTFTIKELLFLATAGALAASAVAFIPLPLRIPGHAILKAALPIVVGVALVPRPFAGSLCGLSAIVTMSAFLALGIGNLPAAAVSSLVAIGPAIDLAMRGARRAGWPLYLRFAMAGMMANLLAFAVRWGTSALELDGFRSHMMSQIGLGAFLSFSLCGLMAGLMSAVICFRAASESE
jgi:hypothetical protein